jgi:glutathione S-transferase
MKIFGDKRSGNCLKILYLADKLRLKYTWQEVDILKGQTRSEAFLARNPAGQVPLVEFEGGRYLAQSNAILLYLGRDSALMPADPWLEAKMMEWLFWEQYSHEPAIAVCRFHMRYLERNADELIPEKVEKGNQALDRMESHLRESGWLAGDAMSLADISLVAYTRVAQEGGFDLSGRPAVRDWIRRVEDELGL